MLKNKKVGEKEKTASILSKINNLVDNIRDKPKKYNNNTFNIDEKKENHFIIDIPNNNKPVNFSTIKPLVICMFQVRLDGLYPFLLFLLKKCSNFLNDLLSQI